MVQVYSAFCRPCAPSCLPSGTRTIVTYSHSCPKIFRRMNDLSVQGRLYYGYSQNEDLKLPLWKEIGTNGILLRASEFNEASVQGDVIQRDQTFKQLVILDMNGVLVRAYPRQQTINISKRPSMFLRYKQVYFRPKLSHFIDKCLESFEIGIWSCLKMDNIKLILKKSIGGRRMDKMLFIWDQSWCTIQGHETTLYGQIRPIFTKDLRKVWKTYPQYGPKNTLLIDDSEYKLKINQNMKYVCPKTYDPEDNEIDQSSFFLWNTIIDHMDECNHIPDDEHKLNKHVLESK